MREFVFCARDLSCSLSVSQLYAYIELHHHFDTGNICCYVLGKDYLMLS